MTNFKSLILGSAAAAIVATTGAQAADAPAAPPREPVYRCDITGFIELPGTDVCFRISGRARLVTVVTQKNLAGGAFYRPHQIRANGHTGGTAAAPDTFEMYATARLRFDARSATEWGTVRAYIELEAADNDGRTGGPLNLRHAFVQFGNWTFR